MTTVAAPVAAAASAGTTPFRTRLGDALADAGAVALAGGISGLVAIGAGSRLSMRLVALSSGTIGTGIRPDSDAIPGEITLDGTMFLLMAGTFIGVVFAVMVALLLERWLPRAGRRRTLVVVGLTSWAPGLLLVTPDNPDFALFGPAWLAVALFSGCTLGYGLLTAALTRRWRPPDRGLPHWVLAVIGVAGLVGTVAVMGSTGLFGLTVAAPIVLVLLASVIAAANRRPRWWFGSGVQRCGEWVLIAGTVVSLGTLALRAARILAGTSGA